MDQQYSTNPPAPPSSSKKWTWKETLTVICLVLIFPLGLILMWAIANWSKTVKIIITLLLIIPIVMIGILISTVAVSLQGARDAARDASIGSQMSMILVAAEMYNMEESSYENMCESLDIKNILDDIALVSGVEPFCQADEDSYCISSQLVSDSSEYLCVSHAGRGYIKCVSASTECK